MATVDLARFSWASGAPGPLSGAMVPGEGHVWAWQPFLDFSGLVLGVSAHPSRAAHHQALAIESLSTAYASTGPAAVNFIVRNVSDTTVWNYSVFVSSVRF
jgi:hypothetical protein